MRKTYVMVVAAICPSCGDTVFSRTQHDMRHCSCTEIAVDGGRAYMKISFSKAQPQQKRIRVYATHIELYEDWNRSKDKFGVIHPPEKTKTKKTT